MRTDRVTSRIMQETKATLKTIKVTNRASLLINSSISLDLETATKKGMIDSTKKKSTGTAIIEMEEEVTRDAGIDFLMCTLS